MLEISGVVANMFYFYAPHTKVWGI